ncbi:FxsA family protein [Paraferrimonas sedimenticola]|uniref:Membrane protein FxsA n=1 Tax=Paraferrimonas sedimenticola TaxID=375674 RepID=A0AA37W0Q1_9GAMM|nr:FxsA family protein [Paraferrimonas sedimenticola]GLP95758.1 membrane protein FxsA [Paraferrimonas sedimenticola]
MFPALVLAFIFIPIIEIAVIIQVGSFLGALTTIAIMVITAIIGAALVREQGLRTLFNLQSRMAQGELPGTQLVEGVLLAVTGVLLVTPGFVTDIAGFLILVPALRQALANRLLTRMQGQVSASVHGFARQPNDFGQNGGFEQPRGFEQNSGFQQQTPKSNGDTFEGEYQRKD